MRIWNGSIFSKDSKFRKTFLTKSNQVQKYMFKSIHQIFISPDSPIKFSYNRSIDIDVHCVVTEYVNEKAKPTYYLIQLTNLKDLDDQRQEWFSEDKEWSLILL